MSLAGIFFTLLRAWIALAFGGACFWLLGLIDLTLMLERWGVAATSLFCAFCVFVLEREQ